MAEQFDISETAKSAQRAVVLRNLQEHIHLTTCDIRDGLGVLMPATRIFELRRQGHSIRTAMGLYPDGEGKLRRQALYVLGGEA